MKELWRLSGSYSLRNTLSELLSREEESYLKAQLFVSHFALHVYKAGAFLMREVTKRVNTLVMFEGEI